MTKLTGTPLRIMKIIHVICSQIWFGSGICIFVYALYCFNNNFDLNTGKKLIEIIPYLYQKAILPFAVICIIQGIIYGIFSNYGFIKYKWVLAKWILTFFVIMFTGIGGIGQRFSIVGKIESKKSQTLIMSDGKTFFAFIIAQIVFLGIMTIISIIKPKGKRNEEKK
jgi:hypothetical protein